MVSRDESRVKATRPYFATKIQKLDVFHVNLVLNISNSQIRERERERERVSIFERIFTQDFSRFIASQHYSRCRCEKIVKEFSSRARSRGIPLPPPEERALIITSAAGRQATLNDLRILRLRLRLV